MVFDPERFIETADDCKVRGGATFKAWVKLVRSRKITAYPDELKGFAGDAIFTVLPSVTVISEGTEIEHKTGVYVAKKRILVVGKNTEFLHRWLCYYDQTPPNKPDGLR